MTLQASRRLNNLLRIFGEHDLTSSPFHQTRYSFSCSSLAFVHLPKTGGSSVHQFFSDHRSCQSDAFVNICAQGIHRPVSRLCPPGAFRYFTVLRNPIDRVWSYYQMVLTRWQGHPYVRYAKQSLQVFLDNCWEARNAATRYYSGFILDEPEVKEMGLAFSNLKKFDAVLDFENLNSELSLYASSLFGRVFDPREIPHRNSSVCPPPSPDDLQLMSNYNYLDLSLYRRWMDWSSTQSLVVDAWR